MPNSVPTPPQPQAPATAPVQTPSQPQVPAQPATTPAQAPAQVQQQAPVLAPAQAHTTSPSPVPVQVQQQAPAQPTATPTQPQAPATSSTSASAQVQHQAPAQPQPKASATFPARVTKKFTADKALYAFWSVCVSIIIILCVCILCLEEEQEGSVQTSGTFVPVPGRDSIDADLLSAKFAKFQQAVLDWNNVSGDTWRWDSWDRARQGAALASYAMAYNALYIVHDIDSGHEARVLWVYAVCMIRISKAEDISYAEALDKIANKSVNELVNILKKSTIPQSYAKELSKF